MTIASNFVKFRTSIRSRLSDRKCVNTRKIRKMNSQPKRRILIKISVQKPISSHSVCGTENTKWSISCTRTDEGQFNRLRGRKTTAKRDRSKNFESKRGRSGIIGRILQPKGLHTTIIHYTIQTLRRNPPLRGWLLILHATVALELLSI